MDTLSASSRNFLLEILVILVGRASSHEVDTTKLSKHSDRRSHVMLPGRIEESSKILDTDKLSGELVAQISPNYKEIAT